MSERAVAPEKHVCSCPTCGARFTSALEPGEARAPFFPFCSERCRALDLGRWLEEAYRIVEPLAGPQGEALPPEA